MNELVPVTHVRDAWNLLHPNYELTYHNGLLTAEQAARINSFFDILVVGGSHGIVEFDADGCQLLTPEYREMLPTQEEYDQAAALVDGLRPGLDVLFVEDFGMANPRPLANLEDTVAMADGAGSCSQNASPTRDEVMLELEETCRELEQERAEYRIDAWEYAGMLAVLRGISVFSADHDAYDLYVFEQHIGMNYTGIYSEDYDPDLDAFMDRTDRNRDLRARNIVKDWLLANLPPEGTPLPMPDERRRVVLLYGTYHLHHLVNAFGNLGLRADSLALTVSDPEECLREHGIVHQNAECA